ncbi:MAG: FkbM family methyltransferase [Cyclobacteriaceae bacterium]|nr:FkbM family methyltransferase [Cyclobacteriaceae bacterium]
MSGISQTVSRWTAKWAFRIFKVQRYVKSAYGLSMLYHKDRTFTLAVKGKYGDDLINELQDLTRDDLFIDIGANIGLFSLWVSKYKGSKVIAFEPNRSIFQLFVANLRKNACESVTPINAAISNVDGEVTFNVVKGHSGKSHISVEETGVKVLSFSKHLLGWIGKLKYQKGTIKIDVEGAELLVLKEISFLLESPLRIQKVIIEINEDHLQRFGSEKQAIYFLMKELGFTPLRQQVSGHYDEIFTRKPVTH